MFVSPTPQVLVYVGDEVTVNPDGAVDLVRTFEFTTDEDSPQAFTYSRQETLGLDVKEIVGSAVPAKAALRLFPPAPSRPGTVTWEIIADVDCTTPVVVQLRARLVSPNFQHPLSYSVTFESIPTVRYEFRLHVPFPELTESSRLKAQVTPDPLEIQRFDDGTCYLIARASLNSTGPIALSFSHEVEPRSTRLMQWYRQHFGHDAPLAGFVGVFALHLLSDVQGFISATIQAGMPPERIFLANIPYSTKQAAVANLWTMGIRNLYITNDDAINKAVLNAIADAEVVARRTPSKLIVVEDGGYIGPYLHEARPELLDITAGIVEQTQNGIWQYEERGVQPRIPLVNVAESALKKNTESPLIGRSIARNVEDQIGKMGFGLGDQRTLLIGFGATGKHAARHLKAACKDLTVFDTNPDRRKEAEVEGYRVCSTLEEGCRDVDLIVGCTGKDSIDSSALLSLKQNTYFANGSSKRRELVWKDLHDLQTDEQLLPAGVRRITLITEATLTLLANGYPVNFVNESVPDEEIAFVYGLLFRSLLLVATSNLSAGLVPVPADIQSDVKKHHYQMLGRSLPDDPDE